MTAQRSRQAQAIRSASTVVGGVAIAAGSVVSTGSWWLVIVFGAVVGGALWEIWKPASKAAASSSALGLVSILTVLLAIIGGAACAGVLPLWLIWAGALSFAVAYCEYLVAYAGREEGTGDN